MAPGITTSPKGARLAPSLPELATSVRLTGTRGQLNASKAGSTDLTVLSQSCALASATRRSTQRFASQAKIVMARARLQRQKAVALPSAYAPSWTRLTV